jgi:hypothetical protein
MVMKKWLLAEVLMVSIGFRHLIKTEYKFARGSPERLVDKNLEKFFKFAFNNVF